MNEEQLVALKAGMIFPATISIYAANADKMTPEEAFNKAKEVIDTMDLQGFIEIMQKNI